MQHANWKTHAIAAVLGAALMLALIEAVLWVLPVQQGIQAAEPDASWPVHRLLPGTNYTYSSGWRFQNIVHGRINHLGYVSEVEYNTSAPIAAVLGDSYIESLMNPYRTTLQARLDRDPGFGRRSFAFASASSSLPDYLGIAPIVRSRFVVDRVVLLVGDGDYDEGWSPGLGHFGWVATPESLVALVPEQRRGIVTRVLRESALIRYLRGNLRLSWHAILHSRPSTAVAACATATLTDTDRARLRAYVHALPAAFGVSATNMVILRDSERDRRILYGDRATSTDCQDRDRLALAYLLDLARSADMKVIDLMPLFRSQVEQHGERVDHSPVDYHWNARGHEIAAQAVLTAFAPGTQP
jgi:hypothetical protein